MRLERFQRVIIKTPEGIEFSLQPAGPVPRCMAWIVDIFCVSVLTMVVNYVVGLFAIFGQGVGMALKIFSFFAIQIGYGMFCEWFFRGQTIGKRLLRLRVVDTQGLRLKPDQVVLRNLLRIADLLPGLYLVGGLVSWFNRRGQRLGDIAANTMVIRQPKVFEPNLEQIMAGKFNSFKEYPHLAARLRQRVSPKEASIALQAILRREEMEPQARITLFDELAEHLQTLTTFPPEATEGITSEQYVRNVVDVVYRPANMPVSKSQPVAANA